MPEILNIITVTKDDLEGLSSTLRSTRILRDRHEVRQIIVDSSNEAIRDKVNEMVKAEKHVEYVWQEPSGIARAFNLGLSLSEAEWIWFLNGGDEVLPDADTDNLLYLLGKSGADALIFELENKQSRTRLKHPPMWALWPPLSAWIPHPATITRRNLYEKYGNFNESYEIAMDFEYWLRCFSKQVQVDLLSIPLVRFDTSGRSYTNSTETSREAISIIKKHFWNMIRIWLMNGISILQVSWYYLRRSKGADD